MFFNFGKCVYPLFFVISFLLLGCSNVLVQESSSGIEVALSVSDDSGRMASLRNVSTSISLSNHLEGWIENRQGERLQAVEQDFSGSTVLSFQQVEPETVARVFVRISDNSRVLYSGKSDFFTVSRRGNHVSVKLNHGDFPVEDVVDDDVAGDDEPVASDVAPGNDEGVDDVLPGNEGGSDNGVTGEGDAATGDTATEETEVAGDDSVASEEAPAILAFDPSFITMTATSRNATANAVAAKGSAGGTVATHNFYGMEGSQIQFSLSQEAVNAGMSLYVNSGSTTGDSSTKFNQGAGTVQYSVQIQRSGENSGWYYFTVNSVMKPVTVTFDTLEYVYAATGSNKNANINIYSLTIGGTTVATTISKTANYGTSPTEMLQSFNVKVTSIPVTVKAAGGSTAVIDSVRNEIGEQTYTLSELWGKSSVIWGTYFRLNYTISQP